MEVLEKKKEEVLIIGNKPCRNFPMGKIIDSFTNNTRCNFIIPGRNNDGYTFDKLAMCNHEYNNFVKSNHSLEKIFSIYTPRYDEGYIKEILPIFRDYISKYNEIYFAQWNVSKHNSFLESIKCPYSIIGLPRTGFTVMMDNILKRHSVFLVNFSLPHTEHKEFGFVEDRSMSIQASKREVEIERSTVRKFEESGGGWSSIIHHTKNEVEIIKWLHEKEIIDASLCLIADKPQLNYILGDMKVSNYINERVESCIMNP